MPWRSTATWRPSCGSGGPKTLALHQCDALKYDFAALARQRGGRLRIVGNLPYNISTPLLFHLLETVDHVLDLHVMLQKEVVDRMAAEPGSDAYGRLTVMLAPRLDVQWLFDVGPGAFQPPPRVWSAVARLVVRPTPAVRRAGSLWSRGVGGVLATPQDPAQQPARPDRPPMPGTLPVSTPAPGRKCWRPPSSPRWRRLRSPTRCDFVAA